MHEEPAPSGTELTTQDAADWLGEEIGEARGAASRVGWSLWALVASLAGVLWLLFDVWEA